MSTASQPVQLDFPTAALREVDFAPVQDLLTEVRRRAGIAKALVTWQNAFTVFKHLERRFGLPRTSADRTVYLAIVNDLRSCGYWVMNLIDQHGAPDWLEAEGLRISAFQACIEELEVDDQSQFLAENPSLDQRLRAALG